MEITTISIHKDNYREGRSGYVIQGIVLHMMQGTLAGTDAWFGGKNIQAGVYSSAHEGIGKNGDVHVYVKPEDTAYHAGRINQPVWPMVINNPSINPNIYLYGIELEGFRGDTWTEAQMQSLVLRVQEILVKYNLPPTRAMLVSHNDIAKDKEDVRNFCDEVIKRINSIPTPVPSKEEIKKQIKELVDKL